MKTFVVQSLKHLLYTYISTHIFNKKVMFTISVENNFERLKILHAVGPY